MSAQLPKNKEIVWIGSYVNGDAECITLDGHFSVRALQIIVDTLNSGHEIYSMTSIPKNPETLNIKILNPDGLW